MTARVEARGDTPSTPEGLNRLNFGVGLGASGLLGASEVNGAVIEDGIVRITEKQFIRREFWFETYYLVYQDCIQGIKWPNGRRPFVAVSVIDDKGLFNSLGAGIIVFLKRTETKDQKDTSALNTGIGTKLTGYNILGEGIVAYE